jgi:hypothetical protein
MWIAIGLIGALWFAGMVIWPDKNAPQSRAPGAPTVASAEAPPPPPPAAR